uniref:Retinoic acid receptor responder 3-like n=1 Tax=Neogobius melanostomus TaxID=47308 RepID=A0A8C6U2T7_9GOBI
MAPTLYDEKPNPGDLIEVDRGSYQHWAVYIGNGFVVHLAPPSEIAGAGANSMRSVLADKAIVREDELWDVVGTDKWSINNSLDEKYTPRPAKDIVREAQRRVGQEVPYCVFRGNCEHFVNELRYGQAESRQVRKAGETVMYTGMAAVIGLGVVALAGTFFGGKKEEKEKNKQ